MRTCCRLFPTGISGPSECRCASPISRFPIPRPRTISTPSTRRPGSGGSGRRRTTAPPGSRSSTVRATARLATSRCLPPNRTSYGSAPVTLSPPEARTPATASTSRPTQGRRGRTWVSKIPTTSRGSSSTPPIRTRFTSRCWATFIRRIRSEEFSRPPTAARRGKRSSSSTTRSASSTS